MITHVLRRKARWLWHDLRIRGLNVGAGWNRERSGHHQGWMQGVMAVGGVMAAMMMMMGALAACGGARQDVLLVSVAANLKPVIEEFAPQIEESLGAPVSYNVGASGKLAQQIEQGAPVDVFLSASPHEVDALIAQGLLDPASKRVFARGRLILWTRDPALPLSGLEDLVRPDIRRIAIANPEHAPYGMAARQALENAGLWQALQPKLILGEDVTQSYQYADTGNVDVAIIPLSLVAVAREGRWVDVPANLYAPLEQTAAIVRDTTNRDAARQFISLLVSPAGQAVLLRHGYALPAEVASP